MEIKESVGKQKPEIVEQAFNIRKNVFIDEQGFNSELDIDEYDETALHFVIQHNQQAIGTLRAIAISNQTLKVGRVAVLKKQRNKGIGRLLMEHVANYGRQRHYQHIILSAQCSAQKFYCSLGYNIIGDSYDEEGVPHIKMILIL